MDPNQDQASLVNKFHNSVIYKICSKDSAKSHVFYIGATTNLLLRKSQHFYSCRNDKFKTRKLYEFMRANGNFEAFNFIELGKHKCENRKELNNIEQEYLKMFKPLLNSNYAQRSTKQYREDNREKIRLINKQYYYRNREQHSVRRKKKYKAKQNHNIDLAKKYYNNNKEKIQTVRKQRVQCLCGKAVQRCNRKKHNMSDQHHRDMMNAFNNNFLFLKQKILHNSNNE